MRRVLSKVSNRTGCFLMFAVLIIMIVALIYIGLIALPGNEVAETLQTMPTS